jgi:bacterioferritin
MKNEVVIEELNTLLRGQYMGIRSFEHYIQQVKEEDMKNTFQQMQQEIKQNAQKIAERIQNLGGVPADDEGVSGSMHSFMHKFMIPDSTEGIIEDAVKGEEQYGVHYSEELVKGDLDPESKRIVHEVIDVERRHVEQFKNLLE